jgi:hypothetical protein
MSAVAAASSFRSTVAGLAAVLLVAAGAMVVGAAASLSFAAGALGASAVTPARCTSAALTITPTLTVAAWTDVVVSGVPAACGGATLQLTVDTGSTNASGTAVVPAGGGSVTVTLPVAQTVIAAMQIDLVLLGP